MIPITHSHFFSSPRDHIAHVCERGSVYLDTATAFMQRWPRRRDSGMGLDLGIEAADVAKALAGDLGLELGTGRGRKAASLSVEFDRELTPADLVRLTVEQGVKPSALQKINDRHRALAKCLAQGMSHGEAGIITGYAQSRISILLGDPSFQELLAFYRSNLEVAEAAVLERVSQLSLVAVAELQDRLDLEPESFKHKELLEIATAGLDRTGHGPQSKVLNVNATLDAATMARLAQAAQEGNVKVIDAQSRRVAGGDADGARAVAGPEASEGQQSQGESVRAGGGEAAQVSDAIAGAPGLFHVLEPVDQVPGQERAGTWPAGSLPGVTDVGAAD